MTPFRGEGHFGEDVGNVVSRDRLKQSQRQPEDASICTRMGDTAEESEELRRAAIV
jgi:hypothetical protein